jgi:hypothetical protein
MRLMPRQSVPSLEFDLLGGGRWSLAEQKPRHFTMIVFYRGCTARCAASTRAS